MTGRKSCANATLVIACAVWLAAPPASAATTVASGTIRANVTVSGLTPEEIQFFAQECEQNITDGNFAAVIRIDKYKGRTMILKSLGVDVAIGVTSPPDYGVIVAYQWPTCDPLSSGGFTPSPSPGRPATFRATGLFLSIYNPNGSPGLSWASKVKLGAHYLLQVV
jgi:hypothetical protein